MRAYSNMPTSQFVAQLRDIAIKAGARALVIDQIDQIDQIADEGDFADHEKEVDDAREEGISEGRDREWEICFDALKALRRDDPQNIGLTEEQLQQILNILTRIDPR